MSTPPIPHAFTGANGFWQLDGVWVGPAGDERLVALADGSSLYAVPEGRHALAALCLHGQPFGFTHSDVEDLRQIVANADESMSILAGVLRRDLVSLADRLAALLPPPATLTEAEAKHVTAMCERSPKCALPDGHTGLHADRSGRALFW